MKVYKSLEDVPDIQNAVVTIGTFDGVHLGHQKIINKLNEIAKEKSGPSVLISFHPHPRLILKPDDGSLKLLTTIEERLDLLKTYGLDIVVLIPFTQAFSRITAVQFIQDILIARFKPATIVIGYDHKFGSGRKGDIQLLKKYAESHSFSVEKISKQTLEDIAISSTKIRDALNNGEIQKASDLMGHHYSLSGFVVKGNRIGHRIGYPTANIEVNVSHKLIPKNGVYAVRVYLGSIYNGMLNIGHRPTFEGIHKTIEVNIFNFDRDIYGESIKVEFIKMIRDEGKFSGVDELRDQLDKDKIVAGNILNDLSN